MSPSKPRTLPPPEFKETQGCFGRRTTTSDVMQLLEKSPGWSYWRGLAAEHATPFIIPSGQPDVFFDGRVSLTNQAVLLLNPGKAPEVCLSSRDVYTHTPPNWYTPFGGLDEDVPHTPPIWYTYSGALDEDVSD